MEWVLLNPVDYIIISIVAMSFILSLRRGLVKEAMSLLIWIVSFIVAIAFSDTVSPYFQDTFTNATLCYGITFVILFFGTLVAGMLLGFLLGKMILATGLSGIDRLLGGVFGFLRGILIVTVAVLLLSTTSIANQSFWTTSQLIPTFLDLSQVAMDVLPVEMTQYLNHDPGSVSINQSDPRNRSY